MFQELLDALNNATPEQKPERLEQAVRAILTHLAESERLRKDYAKMVGG